MTLYHTYGPAASAVNKQVKYAVGPGLLFRSQPDWEILGMSQEAAKEWGKRFQKLFHYFSLSINRYGKEAPLMTGALAGGDSLLFFDYGKKGIFDLIDSGGDVINFQKEGTTLGIYHDKLMRRTGIAKNDGKKVNFKNNNE